MARNGNLKITPQVLLKAYACGIFPMAECAEDDSLFWVEPEARGIIPLQTFHVSKSLRKVVRSNRFRVHINRDFDAVVAGCAAPAMGREVTWINRPIRELYGGLFDMGHCHTVEVYENDELVGGLYGVHLNGAFFGESMFSKKPDASKVALVHLAARLITGQFWLLDTQFTTDHLKRFGAVDVTRSRYQLILETALDKEGDFFAMDDEISGEEALAALQWNDTFKAATA